MSAAPPKLDGNQMLAVAPDETVWLSASAGTGKTHVLSSRVLRLLLQEGVDPSSVLCLTFTKAGATEMASRIKETLARWVRLKDVDLFAQLDAIGAPADVATKDRARTLFARVLDCPGGGLRIDTIHAFAQWLLAAFPHEAGLIPGTRPIEDRERAVLARQVLADLLVQADREPLGDPQLLDAAADLSLRMGPDQVEAYLLRCAAATEVWQVWQSADMRSHVLRLLGLPSDADENGLAVMCADDSFDTASLRRCRETLSAWDSDTGRKGTEAIDAWLVRDGPGRADAIDDLYLGLFTKGGGNPIRLTNILKRDPDYGDHIEGVRFCIAAIRERKLLLELTDRLVPALRLGRAFALAWGEAKQREGLIDFDDQIREAARLLQRSELADWIRYKLDRRFDHVLVDEAQDTNAAQWDIIFALTDEFFAGKGQHGDAMRTLFVVGDYKQAIFSFQGTDPKRFAAARERVREEMAGAAANASMLRSNQRVRELRDYGLSRSFRTSQPVLDFVDAAVKEIGHEALGLDRPAEPHQGWQGRRGYVALWRPVSGILGEAEEEDPDAGEGGQSWLSQPDRAMADKIAQQVAEWLDETKGGYLLAKEERRAAAGDVMVLVRKRRELAALIVARLHAHGVPVAGVDRLRIGDPLAVRDLVAALRFAAQPLDDLNLAALLVSPLIGWSQEDLLRFGYREPHVRLWDHLRAAADPGAKPAMEMLLDLLARADFEVPQQLLAWLLTGPWQGRRKLVARLGHEANDPIDELVNAAHAYHVTATPSLVGFLTWFDAGEGELKREADNAEGLVRVMTVHGSKGLQSPIVILADATGDPSASRDRGFAMPDPADERRMVPLPSLRKEDRAGALAERYEAERAAELEEHWRLLYVAMTRAEEALFIGGALGARSKGEPPEGSWYARLRAMFPAGSELDDPIWGGRIDWGDPPQEVGPQVTRPELPLGDVLPPWLMRAPADDPRPPKPLAPSALGEEDAPDPPLPPGSGGQAARRGVLIHKLLERLPEFAPEERAAAGQAWLTRNAPDFKPALREEMLQAALNVLNVPDWADLFASGSFAEVPIVATIGERVIAGTVDRLLVEDERVLVVDYKTARRPPEAIDDVPRPILRQMAAYVAALEQAWPGRQIEAALLYTATPRLIAIPDNVVALHKAGLTSAQ